ncbi:uncharacterized protein [Antedon mediterranea]|uniref:uncharacterized protein n=1 Tax=Antedon mediterranea TaxID=105859 RepID=UPI003AF995DC
MSTGCCSTHSENNLQFFCSDCQTPACKDCEHIHECYQNQHDVVPIQLQTEQNAMKLIKIAEEVKRKLEESLDSIVANQNQFETHLKLCRCAIDMREKEIIRKVKEKSRELKSHLDELDKNKDEAFKKQLEDLDFKKIQIDSLKASVKSIMNKAEEKDNLEKLKKKIIDIKDKLLAADIEKCSPHSKHVIPTFITSAHLNKLMDTEGIGNIVTVDERFNVAKNDRSITVTKGQQFVVDVSCLIKDEECKLAATLTSSSGEESRPHVKYQGNGDYRITSRCTMEGDWQMKITLADKYVRRSSLNAKGSPVNVKGSPVNVKGSPVNVKVEKLGLVRTIGKISDYIKDVGLHWVSDVMLETNGCMLVSTMSDQMLRFDQSGRFVDKLLMPQRTEPIRMHKMSNGNIVYSDFKKCVVMCDEKLNTISTFGEDTLQNPCGLDVDEVMRVLYVVDENKQCVFKFNIDDGSMLGNIGSEGNKLRELKHPNDVAITKEGNIVVADTKNNRIQIFKADGQKAKVIIGHGEEDGKVVHPTCVTVDVDENLIISSQHKLQLFDKNGVFMRRIDEKEEGLQLPLGSSVISYRPKRLAVANNGTNNIKFFNY